MASPTLRPNLPVTDLPPATMASPKELEMLLDAMIEAWRYFERIQPDLNSKAVSLQSDDTDALVVHATDVLFRRTIRQLRSLSNPVTDFEEDEMPSWNTADERCYRFVVRSMNCFDSFARIYFNFAFDEDKPSDPALKSHLHGADRLVEFLVRRRLPDVQPSSWDCRAGASCDAEDHVHSVDNLIWPSDDSWFEKTIPVETEPCVEWRRFKYKTMPVPEVGFDSLTSAVRALRESLVLEYEASYGKSFDLHHMESYDWSSKASVRKLLHKRQVREAIVAIGIKLSDVLRADWMVYNLGIILPGGSQIFHPFSCDHERARHVYIKMYEVYSKSGLALKFDAVSILWEDTYADNLAVHQFS